MLLLPIIDQIVQVIIPILGGLSIYFLGSKNKEHIKYGFMFGFIAEPFWMFTSIYHSQYGVLFIVCCYAIGHARGYINSKDRD